MTYHLQRQPSGMMALRDRATGEVMHPGLGPWEEANRLYVRGSGLAELLRAPRPSGPGAAGPGGGEVVLFDVGLGGAANGLAALACHASLRAAGAAVRELLLISFENDPAPLAFALAHAHQLGYPVGHEPALEALAARGHWSNGEGVTWEVRQGDFVEVIQHEPRRADVIFFDPFSPRANPAMWSVATLEALHHCRRVGGDTRLVTYSSAVATRAALLLAGFYVGVGEPLGGWRHGTEAATALSLLREPLRPDWLRRWQREARPWPCLTPDAARPAVREALRDHPQWLAFPEGGAGLEREELSATEDGIRSSGGGRRDRPRKARHSHGERSGQAKATAPKAGRTIKPPRARPAPNGGGN